MSQNTTDFLDKEQIDYNQLKRNAMRQDAAAAKVMFTLIMIGCAILAYSVFEPETRKSNGVVVWRDANTIYVQDIKDTSMYYAFAHDKTMTVDSKHAFPLIKRGDTLKYVSPQEAPASFNAVRTVNSKNMADFATEREKMLNAAKVRNAVNQNTK